MQCESCNSECEGRFCNKSCVGKYSSKFRIKVLTGKCKECLIPLTKAKTFCCLDCKTLYLNKKKPTETELKHRRVGYVTTKRKRLKQKAIEYKGGKCVLCGYSKYVGSLDFHHLNPQTKDFIISSGNCKSWEKIKKELDKCVLICKNCHGEIHGGIAALPLS